MNSTLTLRPVLPHRVSWLDRAARHVVTKRLEGLRGGMLILRDASGETTFGDAEELTATLQVRRPQFFRRAIWGGTLSVADAYLQGDWDCDDLTALFRIFIRNRNSAEALDSGLARVARGLQRFLHGRNANTRSGSRRNISAHYDLGNDFYRLWLDDTMAYSSGIFRSPDVSLREASTEKFDRICRKLELQPGDHVLEIGTGWGGFAIHAAKHYDCQITSTTISQQQYKLACERVAAENLSDRISLLQQDYRDLRGQFDRLVSIEMIEAVGHEYLDDYFRQCSQLLRSDGSLVLQAIVMPEQGYARYLQSVDFIQKYVFPGGCLPSVGSMLDSVGRVTDLRLVHVEDLAPHYAETLRRWRTAFHERLDEVRDLGYSRELIRMWHYYLCYCEAAFEERCIGVVQVQFDKPHCRRDPATISERAARKAPRWEPPITLSRRHREPRTCSARSKG